MSALTLENAALLAELSNGERGVALYSSGMPVKYRFRRGEENRIAAWISEGTARVGRGELEQLATRSRGFHLLSLNDLLTEETVKAHRSVFPDVKRELRAMQVAALTAFWVSANPAARARNLGAAIPGVCLCGGTGRLADGGDPDAPIPSPCPVHWWTAHGTAVAV